MDTRYYDGFENVEDVRRDFVIDASAIADEEILFAVYADDMNSYGGIAFVLFERGGKLYEVNGSHCSCYGLEEQWEPEETTWAALRMRSFYHSFDNHEEIQARIAELATSVGE